MKEKKNKKKSRWQIHSSPLVVTPSLSLSAHMNVIRVQVVYLKRVSLGESNCDLTRVKAIISDNVFNSLSFMAREKVTRLSILIPQLEPLCESEVGPILASHLDFKILPRRHPHLDPS